MSMVVTKSRHMRSRAEDYSFLQPGVYQVSWDGYFIFARLFSAFCLFSIDDVRTPTDSRDVPEPRATCAKLCADVRACALVSLESVNHRDDDDGGYRGQQHIVADANPFVRLKTSRLRSTALVSARHSAHNSGSLGIGGTSLCITVLDARRTQFRVDMAMSAY